MTTVDFARTRTEPRSINASIARLVAELKTAWCLHRTRHILSGLDEMTLKDIGAPRPGGAAAAVDPRMLRRLDTLR